MYTVSSPDAGIPSVLFDASFATWILLGQHVQSLADVSIDQLNALLHIIHHVRRALPKLGELVVKNAIQLRNAILFDHSDIEFLLFDYFVKFDRSCVMHLGCVGKGFGIDFSQLGLETCCRMRI